MSKQQYRINKESGELAKINLKEMPRYKCAIFLTKKDEELEIEGSAPLVFTDTEQLRNHILKSGVDDIISWLEDDNLTITIKRIDIFE